jgi:hypothetical protein
MRWAPDHVAAANAESVAGNVMGLTAIEKAVAASTKTSTVPTKAPALRRQCKAMGRLRAQPGQLLNSMNCLNCFNTNSE